MNTNAYADLFEAVKCIAPVIQQHADEAERAGRLSRLSPCSALLTAPSQPIKA